MKVKVIQLDNNHILRHVTDTEGEHYDVYRLNTGNSAYCVLNKDKALGVLNKVIGTLAEMLKEEQIAASRLYEEVNPHQEIN